MATFYYQGYSAQGARVEGKMEATDQEELIHRLRAQGTYCHKVKVVGEQQGEQKPLKTKDLTNFCRQLAAMTTAGINISRALNTLYHSNGSKRIQAASLSLYESVLRGHSLSQSMQQLGGTFPELLISMVAAGEASGNLDQILEDMANHFDQELALKKKAQSALIYPCVLALVSVVVVIFMLTSVLPQFVSMYDGVELPAATQFLLFLSDLVSNQWPILLGVLLGLAFVWVLLMNQHSFRVAVKRMQLRLPVAGKLLRTILTARFASTFSILYGSGVGVLQSTQILSRVMDNEYLELRLKEVEESLRQGQMFSLALEQLGVFDPLLTTMMAVGEESGSLDTMLKKTGSHFQREAETALGQMVALLEPVMIVTLGLVIGFIVLAIITPTFSMYQQIL